MSQGKVAVVVGVGPGLGAAVVRRFTSGGYAVAAVARSAEHVRELGALAVEADTADKAAVAAAAARVEAELGPVDVLVFNAGAFAMGGILDITPEQLEACWRVGCLGALLWAQRVLPGMVARKRGTVIMTGATASLRGSARFAALAVPKFGLRALAQSMAREFGPQGVHVAHVVIDGQIDTPGVRQMMPGRDAATMLSPEAIAETYWQLAAQDPTAWTHEIDVRPAVEKF